MHTEIEIERISLKGEDGSVKENIIGDVTIDSEDLYSLLPESNTYDDMFLTSFIHLPVPIYYSILIILKMCAYFNYCSGRNTLHNCILEIYFLILFVPLWIRYQIYFKMYDDNWSFFSKVISVINQPLMVCAIFVSENHWKETEYSMRCAPGLKSFPSPFNGGAPSGFAFGMPLLSVIMFAVSYSDPNSSFPIVALATFISALSHLVFGFSASWFPSKEGINLVNSKTKKLDFDVRRVREEVMASSDNFSPLWHAHNWKKKISHLAFRTPLELVLQLQDYGCSS